MYFDHNVTFTLAVKPTCISTLLLKLNRFVCARVLVEAPSNMILGFVIELIKVAVWAIVVVVVVALGLGLVLHFGCWYSPIMVSSRLYALVAFCNVQILTLSCLVVAVPIGRPRSLTSNMSLNYMRIQWVGWPGGFVISSNAIRYWVLPRFDAICKIG